MFQPVTAAYAFYFRELLPDRERNSENYHPVLVTFRRKIHASEAQFIGLDPFR
jgi:hypothetical protein